MPEATRPVDQEGGLGDERALVCDILDRDDITVGREDSVLNVSPMSVPDIDALALSKESEQELGDGTLELVSGEEELRAVWMSCRDGTKQNRRRTGGGPLLQNSLYSVGFSRSRT